MLGTNFPYTKHLPDPGKTKIVQVDIEPTRAGTRVPVELPLIGDVTATLEALLPLIQPHTEHPLLTRYQEKMQGWRRKMAALETVDRDPIAPQYLAALPEEARSPWRTTV